MPPKKNIDGKPAATTQNIPKKLKEKIIKPKLRIPTVIKIKIGAKNNINNLSTKAIKANKLSKKQLALQKKFDLANEVAAAQLLKPKPEVEPPPPSIAATASPGLVALAPPGAAESLQPKKRVRKSKDAGGPVGIINAAPEFDVEAAQLFKLKPEVVPPPPSIVAKASPRLVALAPPGAAESLQPKKKVRKSKDAGGPVGIINAAPEFDVEAAQFFKPKPEVEPPPPSIVAKASPGLVALAPPVAAESLKPKKRVRKSKDAGGPVGIINAAPEFDASPGLVALAPPDGAAESLQPKKRVRKPKDAGGPVGIINAALESDASPGLVALAPPDGAAEYPKKRVRKPKDAGGPVGIINAVLESDASPGLVALAPSGLVALAPPEAAASPQPKKRGRKSKDAGGPVGIINAAPESHASPGLVAVAPPGAAESLQPKKRVRKPKGAAEPVGIINAAPDSDASPGLLALASPGAAESLQPKKRGRKPKDAGGPVGIINAALESDDAFEASPAKKNCVRKEPKRIPTKEFEVIKENKAKKSLSLSLKTTKQGKTAEINKEVTLTNKKSPIVSRKSTRNKITTTEPKPWKRKILAEKGKTDLAIPSVTAAGQSTSILDQIEVATPKKETLSYETSADPNFEACPIDSRKTSLNSECLSWTKDISSSSTTTCVTFSSNDIVRIDKKLPFVKCVNIDYELTKAKPTTYEESSSSSSDSDSSCSGTTPKRILRTPEFESRCLNLSTSSTTPTESPSYSIESSQNTVSKDDHDKLTYVLDKLTSKLKNFDLEIINWIGYNNEDVNIDVKRIQNKIMEGLKEESEVIAHCQQLKKILSNIAPSETDNNGEMPTDDNVLGMVDSNPDMRESNNTTAVIEENKSPTKVANIRSENEENFTRDAADYISFDQNYDDDDALSLFAESLTGMDSSRRNSTATSISNTIDFDDYEPPVQERERWEPAKKISFPPPITFNFDKPNLDINKTKTVCEKQNADSTSIYKETERNKNNVACNKPNVEKYVNNNSVVIKNTKPVQIKRPVLMASIFKTVPGKKSIVFSGICFFNLLNSCKNPVCRFPHHKPDNNEITAILVRLSEEMFIQEYMLLRNWPDLRREYGMCFVQECKRRELARFLVEMAIDFIMKANDKIQDDATLKLEVVECVLMHLNTVDLNSCSDLLMYYVQQGVPLCDVFMQAIANTQNFSRFKQVFISLTKFILSYERTFILDVASQILERLCILPCEQPLLEALMDIVKHTDYDILNNCMIGHFEKQLLAASEELHQQFLEFKKEVSLNRPVLKNLYEMSPLVAPEVEPLVQPLVTEREKRYTSPDTTNLDNMNKMTEEPIISFDHTQLLNIQRSFSNPNSSIPNDSTEEYRPMMHQQPKYKNYRKNIAKFNNMRRMSPMVRRGTPRPPLIKRHIHQQPHYRPGSSQYMRRPGPDFF